MARSDLLTGEHAQGEVLDQVVGVNGRSTKERGDDEERRWDDEKPRQRPTIGTTERTPPARGRFRGHTHSLYARKNNEAAVDSRGLRTAAARYLASTRSRASTSTAVAVTNRWAAGAQVADLAGQLGLEGRFKGRRLRARVT